MPDTLERLRAALHDRYDVQRQVGQGGMATVFLAQDRKHRRQVAIKLLRPDLSATIGAERFLREIETSARLQHPHIIPVYDSGAADGFLYYVMPYVEGESLRDLLQREGRLPLARAAEIVREVASGLAYAHAQGVVHRDIKPENIMLSAGHAVVADFGIARAIDASREGDPQITGAGLAIGTPAYMSPEQATADTVDARSDQYALACVFYEMVSGRQPFTGGSMQAMLTAVLTGPRPKLSSVATTTPPEVDAATQRALSANPAERFPDITAFAAAVAQESSGAAAATRESRRWKRLALALPLLVAAVAAGWYLLAGPPGRVVVSGAETIAVVPFATTGAAADGLGEGMVDLLAGNLDGVGPIRAIEPRSILREWRRRVQPGEPFSTDDALAVGRSVRAASVLTGSIVATGGTARVIGELVDLQGAPLARVQVDGPADSILALADRLALDLLREIWRSREPLPSANTSGITSTSMPAIRAYLDGERHLRRGQWDSAQVAFERAVTADSTFALAWYKLANTLGWQGNYTVSNAIQASARAVRYSDALPPRVRRILVAYELFQLGDPAATDSMRSYVTAYPEDADGWYLLGESQYHTRLYRPLAPAQLLAPFDRVLALDSSLTPAAIHPIEVALFLGDSTLARQYVRVLEAADAGAEVARATAALAILGGGTDDEQVARFRALGPPSGMMRSLLTGRFLDPEATGSSGMALAGLWRDAVPPDQRVASAGVFGMTLAGLGRMAEARAIADSMPPGSSELPQFVRLIPYYGGYATAEGLAATRTSFDAAARQNPNPYLHYHRALLALDAGDPSAAGAAIQAARAFPDEQLPPFLRAALTALDGVRIVAAGDTVRGLAVADSGLRMPMGMGNSFAAPVALRVAQLRVAYRPTRADGISRLRHGFEERNDLLPITRYYLGKAYEAAGEPDSAVAAYGQFVRLWDRADSNFVPRVEEARAALQRLTAEGAR